VLKAFRPWREETEAHNDEADRSDRLVTVNLQGKTVELPQHGEDALFGRASYGKYAYASASSGCFGLLARHGIRQPCSPRRRGRGEPAYIAGAPPAAT